MTIMSGLVGRAIQPADPLSSGSSRLERRLQARLPAPHGFAGFQTQTTRGFRRSDGRLWGLERWLETMFFWGAKHLGPQASDFQTAPEGRRRNRLFEAATTWFNAEGRGLGECGRGSREVQSCVHEPQHMRTGQRACARVRQQPRPPSQAFYGAAGIVCIRRVRIVGYAVL